MEELRHLRVHVCAAQARTPLEGATVLITRNGARCRTHFVCITQTGTDGAIAPVPLDTAQSYAVWADCAGYTAAVAEDVALRPDGDTQLHLELAAYTSEGNAFPT